MYRQIIFKFDIQESNYVMTGDEDQIKQVLVNVVKNACDAMSDTVKKELIVNLNSDGHNFKIEITDTGNGIPKDNQSKVFTPFFTTKSMGKGTGLGLAISYGIIKMHKGNITFVSEIGKGTTFKIVLPKYQAYQSNEAIEGAKAL